MEYHYICPDKLLLKDIDQTKISGMTIYLESEDVDKCRLIWVVKHGMFEKPEVLCPITNKPAIRIIVDCPTFYTKGNGLVNDVAGARRDMNLYRLQQEDPYAHMRERGEKDDLIHRLKNGGKHNGHKQYFTAK